MSNKFLSHQVRFVKNILYLFSLSFRYIFNLGIRENVLRNCGDKTACNFNNLHSVDGTR